MGDHHEDSASPVLNYAAPSPANPMATASMALGLISLACIPLFCAASELLGSPGVIFGFLWPLSAILAIVYGLSGSGRADLVGAGRGNARAGMIVGAANLVLFVLFLVLLPNVGAAKPRAKRVMCASNLRQIGQGLMMYANDHQGRYPPRFDPLIIDYGYAPELFVCPSSRDDKAQGPTTQALLADFAKPGRCSYIYLGARFTTSSPAEVVLAYEKIDHHEGDGANFLFNDGHAEFIAKEQAKRMIQELTAGQNPPPCLTSGPPPANTDSRR